MSLERNGSVGKTGGDGAPPKDAAAPGKTTLVETQSPSNGGGARGGAQDAAAAGVAGADSPLPYLDRIRQSFGKHDVSNVKATIGGKGAAAGGALGAEAYTFGDRVAFGSAPDLHTAAHEAAHVVQQRAGVNVSGGMGKTGDKYEQHADAVADAVVAGRSAEALLDQAASPDAKGGAPAIQRRDSVKANEFVEFNTTFNEEVGNAITGIQMVPRGPYGQQLAGTLDEELKRHIAGGAKAGNLVDYYQDFVAPDDMIQLIDRARGHDVDYTFPTNPQEHRDVGPSSKTYVRQVAIEVANAIARRYLQVIPRYMERLLERHVRAMVMQAKDLPDQFGWKPEPKQMRREMLGGYDLSDLTASHPVDLAVKKSLEFAQLAIDLEAIARTRDDLWNRFDPKVLGPFLPSAEPETPEAEKESLHPVNLVLRTTEGMHHWCEVSPTSEGKRATAEEVALELFAHPDGDNDTATQHAHLLIDVSPLWGFPGRAVGWMKPQYKMALQKSAEAIRAQRESMSWAEGAAPNFPGDIAAVLGLANTSDGGFFSRPEDPINDLVRNRPELRKQRATVAVNAEASNKDAVSVVARLTEALKVCEIIGGHLAMMEAASFNLSSVIDDLSTRRTEAQGTDMEDPPTEWMLADQQATVLADIASGFGEIAFRRKIYAYTDDDGYSQIDVAVQEVIADARAPFEQALIALDFPEVAAKRAALGTQRAMLLDITLQEVSLHRGMSTVDDVISAGDKTANFSGKDAQEKSDQDAYDLGGIRMDMMQNPGKGQEALTKKTDEVQVLEFDINLGAKLKAIDGLWHAIDDENDFWSSSDDDRKGYNLEGESNQLRQDLLDTISTPWAAAQKIADQGARIAEQNRIRTAFRTFLLERLKPFADKVQKFITATEKHKFWKKLIAGILIAVVAFALGQFEFAFLIDAGLGIGEAAVIAGAATTLTSMALEKLILNQDPTLGSVIMGFAGNIAIFGIVGKMAMAARAAGVAAEVGEAGAGAAAKAMQGTEAAAAATKSGALATALKGLAKEVVFGEVFMLISAEGQSMIDKGRGLTGPEMLETAAMGVVNIIGMKIATFPFEAGAKAFKAFEGAKLEGKADIAGLTQMRLDLQALGDAVNKEAGGPGHIAEGRVPRERAQELLEKWRDYHKKEQEVGEALLELAKDHPEKFKLKIGELETAKEELGQQLKDGADLNRQLRAARALLGVEEIGPGVYRGDPAAMDAILSEHKASHSDVVGVSTDPVTGQRTLKFRTADGAAIEMIEKLADPKQRKPPRVSVEKARHFEGWLESTFDVNTFEGAKNHARMTEYYARDPEAAMHLAETAYDYKPGKIDTPELMPGAVPEAPAAEPAPAETAGKNAKPAGAKKGPKGPKGPEPGTKPGVPAEPTAAQKAYEHYEYTREDNTKNSSNFGEEFTMDASDFKRWYEAGYEYDPLNDRWVSRGGEPEAGTTRAGTYGAKGPPAFGPADHKTLVLGEVPSQAVGHSLMSMLAIGDANALRVIGIEPPPGFDSRTTEWALGKKGDKIVLIKGDHGEVKWSSIPGVEDIGHSHPLFGEDGQPRLLKGHDGQGTIDFARFQKGDVTPSMFMDLIYLLPSTGDLHFVAIKGAGGGGHRVTTPFVWSSEGKIGNPVEGGNHAPVEFTIDRSEPIGLLTKDSSIVVYKAELGVWEGDNRVGTMEIYERYHSEGSFRADWITMEKPDGVVDLPADHKLSTKAETPAGKAFDAREIGNVGKDTVTSLVHQGMTPPEKGSPMETALKRLTPDQAGLLKEIAMSDRVDGFQTWIDRVTEEPTKMPRALHDLDQVRTALEEEPSRQVTFDKDGKPRWEGDGKKAKIRAPETEEQAKAREAKEAEALGDQAEATKRAFKRKGKLKEATALIDTLESHFGSGKQTTNILEMLQSRTDIDPARYQAQAGAFLDNAKVAPAQKRAIVERSLSPEVPDPVKFLENANWVADRTTTPEATANLLNSASSGMLDIEWLRSLDGLTPTELDTLGSRSYMAWNKAKIAAEYERMVQEKKAAGQDTKPKTKAQKRAQEEAGKANAAVNPQLRGVAGEVVAQDIELPRGFKLERRGTPQADGMEPDYVAMKGKVEADLEVKSNSPDDFKSDLQQALKGKPSDSMKRMIKQLDGSLNRGRKAFLAVSDGISNETGNGGEKLLRRYLQREGLGAVEIVFMSEGEITSTAQLLREHLGIRTPK